MQNLVNLALGRVNGSSHLDAARVVKAALEELTVISDLGVWASAESNASAETVTLILDVQFHYGELVRHPLNLGSMPPLGLVAANLTGLRSHSSTVLVQGQPPVNFSFPEQLITLNATAESIALRGGGLSFHFNGAQTSTTVPVDASATQLRECLSTMSTIGEIEVFRSQGDFGISWLVRFYAEGYPAHIGPQPTIYVNVSQIVALPASSTGRRLSGGCQALECFSVGVQTTAQGTSPFAPDGGSD